MSKIETIVVDESNTDALEGVAKFIAEKISKARKERDPLIVMDDTLKEIEKVRRENMKEFDAVLSKERELYSERRDAIKAEIKAIEEKAKKDCEPFQEKLDEIQDEWSSYLTREHKATYDAIWWPMEEELISRGLIKKGDAISVSNNGIIYKES